MKLVYTEEAIQDLIRLKEFIAIHNPDAATRIAKELLEKIQLLTDFPKLGIPVLQAPIPESVRDIIFGKYIVRYSIHKHAIIILRIWHALEDER